MCPDQQILSVYFDGELTSPWKEKLEAHLETCDSCRRRIEAYRGLSAGLKAETGNTGIERSRERVWERLNGNVSYHHRRMSLWTHRVSVPLPAAAAAAAVFVVLCTLLAVWSPVRSTAADPSQIAAAAQAASIVPTSLDSSIQETIPVPVTDMNGVLQYLGSQDNADYVILKLPESRNFLPAGEPTILKAADYRRNVSQ